MKRIFTITLFTFIYALLSIGALGQNIVTRDILDRVFLFQYGSKSGTCFAVNVNKNVYLITARHIFPNSLANNSEIEVAIARGKNVDKLKARLLVHRDSTVDIAVLDTRLRNDSSNAYRVSSDNVSLSQDCFFLGYPYGFRIEDIEEKPINGGFPFPFVKKAVVSGFVKDSRSYRKENRYQLILDGINNSGFSGGPVVVFNKEVNPDRKISIVAVISGYFLDRKDYSVLSNKLTIESNSGLVTTTPIEYVFEIIDNK